jgi:hypothetical protein
MVTTNIPYKEPKMMDGSFMNLFFQSIDGCNPDWPPSNVLFSTVVILLSDEELYFEVEFFVELNSQLKCQSTYFKVVLVLVVVSIVLLKNQYVTFYELPSVYFLFNDDSSNTNSASPFY